MTKKQKRTTRILIILLIIAIIIYSLAKKKKLKGCASQGLETDENGNCISPTLYYCTGVWDGIGASQPYQPCVNGARPDGITPEGGCKTLAEIQVSCVNPYTNGGTPPPPPPPPNEVVDNAEVVLPEQDNDGCINSRIGFSPINACVENKPVDPPIVKPEIPKPRPKPRPEPKPDATTDSGCYSGNSDCKRYVWDYMNIPKGTIISPVITDNETTTTNNVDYGYKCVGASNPADNCQPCTEQDTNIYDCMSLTKCQLMCLNSPAPPS